ncbi:hypothetical protein [Actinokineospora sp. NBRC 105648]|uniref:hypothetical protein n=1 Tax=Actinokineospora sp. NBRC 105648 TaxID=3032206 RepID=UPI0024A1EBCA|nr:hypothetical protein [Actinokineospora sp. NBRC 105648]GLZ41116.1 hypothetical protein Acsp05_47400 [Actinokineospora sp. NBRC 105648]
MTQHLSPPRGVPFLATDLRDLIALAGDLLRSLEEQTLTVDQVDTFDDVTAEVITTCRWLASVSGT